MVKVIYQDTSRLRFSTTNKWSFRIPTDREWTDKLMREINSAGAKATREALDNWVSLNSPRDKILDFIRSQQSYTNRRFAPSAKPEAKRPTLKDLPNLERSMLENIIETLREHNRLIEDAPPDKTEYVTELAKTVWYAQQYVIIKGYPMVPLKLGNKELFPGEIKVALEDQFTDLMTKSLLSKDLLISSATATVFDTIPAGKLLRAEEPLERAFEKTIGQLTNHDARKEDRETAISIINRLAPALHEGHPMIYRMAYKVHGAIEHAKDDGRAEIEAKLIETYGAVAEKFHSTDRELKYAWGLLSQETIDRPDIVMTAAQSVCQNLLGTFPNLNYLNMPTPIVMR